MNWSKLQEQIRRSLNSFDKNSFNYTRNKTTKKSWRQWSIKICFTSCSVNLFCFSHREVNKNLFIFWPIRWDFCGKDLFLYFENQLFSGVNNKKAQKQSQYWKKTLLANFQNRSKMNDIENKLFADHFCHSLFLKILYFLFFMYYFHPFSLLFYILLEWNFVIISSCCFMFT